MKKLLLVMVAVIMIGCVLVGCGQTSELQSIKDVELIEVERFSVGAEISHLDRVTYHNANTVETKTQYFVSVRNDDFSAEFEITSEQYANRVVGDIVEIEVTVWENEQGEISYTHKYLGDLL